jgi:hypothetical protein
MHRLVLGTFQTGNERFVYHILRALWIPPIKALLQ